LGATGCWGILNYFLVAHDFVAFYLDCGQLDKAQKTKVQPDHYTPLERGGCGHLSTALSRVRAIWAICVDENVNDHCLSEQGETDDSSAVINDEYAP